MQISVIHPAELGDRELGAWHDLQARSEELRNPFLCPEFAIAVGQSRKDARVAVISDDGGLAGFFAFEQGRLNVVGGD